MCLGETAPLPSVWSVSSTSVLFFALHKALPSLLSPLFSPLSSPPLRLSPFLSSPDLSFSSVFVSVCEFFYVFVCVRVRVCVSVFVMCSILCFRVCVRICVCMLERVDVCVRVCQRKCLCVCMRMCARSCCDRVRAFVFARTCPCFRVFPFVFVRTCSCVHVWFGFVHLCSCFRGTHRVRAVRGVGGLRGASSLFNSLSSTFHTRCVCLASFFIENSRLWESGVQVDHGHQCHESVTCARTPRAAVAAESVV